MSYRNYSTAVSHIVDQNGLGDFTTIAAAITAASAGDTIFIRSGTYTENITLKTEVDLIGDSVSETIIDGLVSFSSSGPTAVRGLRIQSNGSYAISITSSSDADALFEFCNIVGGDDYVINNTNSNANTNLTLRYCGYINTLAGSSGHINHTSAGRTSFEYCSLRNTGGISASSDVSAGQVRILYCTWNGAISFTGTSQATIDHCNFDLGQNVTLITYNSSGSDSRITNSRFDNLNATPVTITSGTLEMLGNDFNTSSGTLTDGAGTVNFDRMGTLNTGDVISTTTTNAGDILTGGISFDKGTNLLKFYEEGSWTPSIVPKTGAFTTITYSTQSGSYTRIGNKIYIECAIVLSAFSIGTGADDIRINGLPTSVTSTLIPLSIFYNDFDWDSATYTGIVPTCQSANTRIVLKYVGDNVSGGNVFVSALTATTSLYISGFYTI